MADLPVGVPKDQITAWLRGQDYQHGLELLKQRMIPALQGHDYVPPYSNFNDAPTEQQLDRNWDKMLPNYDYLKLLEKQMQEQQQKTGPLLDQTPAGWPIGYNSNNQT